jgi:acetyl esterase/lipase
MRSLLFITLLALVTYSQAETLTAIPLWPDGAPGATGKEDQDIPTLTPFLPNAEKATGVGIVVCPGGGYGGLAGHEGAGYAEWLAQQGIAAFVLKYRLGSAGYRHPVMLNDAARAMRLARSKAGEWKVDPHRMGIMGSSAGGHLASTLVTHYDSGNAAAADVIEQQSSRPDFGILCYAVISMGANTHGGSKQNLLGNDPSPELVELLSNEKQVTKDTPPCFIWHTWDDSVVKVENALEFATAMRAAGVKFDLHIYQRGPHGIGLSVGKHGAAANEVHPWATDLLVWMRQNAWLK